MTRCSRRSAAAATRNATSCAARRRGTTVSTTEIHRTLAALVTGLTPTTRAYSEIWLDGELAASNEPDPPDTLYGERYLPRKFKTAIAIEGDNCIDIYANDLGLGRACGGSTARSPGSISSSVAAWAGPRTSRTHGRRWRNRWGTCSAENVVEAARAVVAVQRDFGDRTERRHARLEVPDRTTAASTGSAPRCGRACRSRLSRRADCSGKSAGGSSRLARAGRRPVLLRPLRRERAHPRHRRARLCGPRCARSWRHCAWSYASRRSRTSCSPISPPTSRTACHEDPRPVGTSRGRSRCPTRYATRWPAPRIRRAASRLPSRSARCRA